MKKLYLMMSMAAVALAANAVEVRDTLTIERFGVINNSYQGVEDVILPSGNVYAADVARYKNTKEEGYSIQINNSASGNPRPKIYTTTTVGTLKSATINWSADTDGDRMLAFYGSNNLENMKSSIATQDLLGTSQKLSEGGYTQTVEFDKGYFSYVGFTSPSKAQYINSIILTYEVEGEEEVKEYCNRYGDLTINRENRDRYLSSLTLTAGEESLVVDEIQTPTGKVYNDRTEEVLAITPGQEVTIKADSKAASASWMHSYLWVDWNRDYQFTAELEECPSVDTETGEEVTGYRVTANSELLAYNFYNPEHHPSMPDPADKHGWDSEGNWFKPGINNGFNAQYTFTVPADLAAGAYRLRYIIQWNCIDPCGAELDCSNPLTDDGGSITDITLLYDPTVAVEGIEAAENVAPVYYNLQGVRVNNPANGVYIVVKGDKAEKVLINK